MPCDHQGATFDTRDESHRANCEWCKTGEWAAHRFDSSGHVCPECGYSRVLVSFDANGGTKSMEPVYAKQGSDYKLPICRFSPPEGMVFIGWSVNGGEELFPPNTPLAFDGDTTLTANWSDYLGLFVNDVAVSQNNKNDILGDGAVSFDSDSCVLTLNNAAITKISAESIALTVRGSGVINNPSGTAIFVHTGSLTIDGDFDITASDIGLKTEGTSSAAGKVNIAGGNISIAGGSRGISSQSGLYICNEIERLEVTANTSYGSKAINAYNILNGSFVIESELSVKEPENGRIYGPDISGDPTHVIIEPKIVTVSFDANGANDTGAYAMEPVAGKQTNVIDLPDCAFQTPSEKVFAGWSLGGKTYQPGDGYTLSEDVTFTAVWKNELCTLTIHSNTGDDETETYSIPYGEDFIIPDNEFDYPDDMLLIKRWKEDPVSESKLHKFGAIITVTDDMDLYGMYSPNHTHTLMPVEAVAAACETRGNIACRQCQMCGKYYADENASQRIGEDAIYIPATGHTPGEAVREYEYPPSVGTHGSYNSVVYCTVCEQELSRELIFLPMTAIGYVDENGGDHSAADYALLTPETEELTGWVAATTGMTNQNRLTVSGEANLILFDGANVTVPKGIAVNEGANLTIWQQSDGSGTLIAAAETDSYNAAIGGNSGKSSGLITINGGVVDATGSKYGAGIGGGNQHIGTVVINGGSVTAQGGYHAAGIGGGTQGLATVTVNGGVVNATGGDSGAGIGAGYNNAYLPNKALNVTINGGIITATGGSGASAIGCGDRTDYGSCSVSINGGQITANGGVSSKCTDSRQGSIILNWTDDSKASMSLTSDSYSGALTLSKTFRDENGNIYGATDSADNSALAGKTLTPCEGIFAGYSLSLGGDIGVNFYLDLPDEALAQGVRIDFAWNGKTDSVTFDSNSTAETREGVVGLYKATCNVCAAEMNDAVTACVTVGESAGPVETVSRKVRDYADYILANKDGKYSDKLRGSHINMRRWYRKNSRVNFGLTRLN